MLEERHSARGHGKPVVVLGITSAQTCLVLRERLCALREAGFRVILVSNPGSLLAQAAASEQVEAIAIPIERRIAPLRDLISLFHLWRLLRRLKPDLVEFSTPKAGLLGMLAARLCRLPRRIYLLRGLRMETARGAKRWILLFSERLASRSAHLILCNSKSLRDQAVALRLAPKEKIHVLGSGSSHGVNLQRFSPGPTTVRQQYGIPAAAPVIGFVGRLTCDKGVPELIEAFDAILRERPDAVLLLVGWFDSSDDAISDALRRRIENHPSIRLTGFVESTAEFYRAMDLLVLPTWREGFPNVVLEASASCLPVITTRTTGARDSVLPEVTGFLIEPGYPEAIREAVLALLDDPERRRRMGQQARVWVQEHFIDTRLLALTVRFYRHLLQLPRAGTSKRESLPA